jgi:hypothetical protein
VSSAGTRSTHGLTLIAHALLLVYFFHRSAGWKLKRWSTG